MTSAWKYIKFNSIFKDLLLLLYGVSEYMSIATCTVLWRSQECAWFPGTGMTVSCQLQCGCPYYMWVLWEDGKAISRSSMEISEDFYLLNFIDVLIGIVAFLWIACGHSTWLCKVFLLMWIRLLYCDVSKCDLIYIYLTQFYYLLSIFGKFQQFL